MKKMIDTRKQQTSSDEMTSGTDHLSLVLADITSKPRKKGQSIEQLQLNRINKYINTSRVT
jgi:hypothetical protein